MMDNVDLLVDKKAATLSNDCVSSSDWYPVIFFYAMGVEKVVISDPEVLSCFENDKSLITKKEKSFMAK